MPWRPVSKGGTRRRNLAHEAEEALPASGAARVTQYHITRIKIMESTAHQRVLIVTRDELLRGVANDVIATRGWLSAAFSDSPLAFQYFCGHFHEIPAVIVNWRDNVRRATDLARRLVEMRGDVQPFLLASRAPGALLSAAFLRCFEPNDRQDATLKNVPAPAPPTRTPVLSTEPSRSSVMRNSAACRAAS